MQEAHDLQKLPFSLHPATVEHRHPHPLVAPPQPCVASDRGEQGGEETPPERGFLPSFPHAALRQTRKPPQLATGPP